MMELPFGKKDWDGCAKGSNVTLNLTWGNAMNTENAQTASKTYDSVDYGLPEYSDAELLEIERDDEMFFNEKTKAVLREILNHLDKVWGESVIIQPPILKLP